MADRKSCDWKDDGDAREILTEYGVKAGPMVWVPMADIDLVGSRKGNPRFSQEVSSGKRDDYAFCMKKGNVFPCLCLLEREAGPYRVLGGSTRAAACEQNKYTHAMAMIVPKSIVFDDKKADALAVALNAANPTGYTTAEKVANAIDLHDRHGYSPAEAADIAKVSLELVKRRMSGNKAIARASGLDIDLTRVDATKLEIVSRIKNRHAFAAVAGALSECPKGVTGDELSKRIGQINGGEDEGEQVEAAAALAKEILSRRNKRVTRASVEELVERYFKLLLDKLTEARSLSGLGPARIAYIRDNAMKMHQEVMRLVYSQPAQPATAQPAHRKRA